MGLYLYGSLAAGDFDPGRSDVDLLAVVSSVVDREQFDRLDAMHGRFVGEYPAWDGRIEVAYVSAPALRRFRIKSESIAIVSPGELFHRKEAGNAWLMNWYMVREIGVTLFGPPPRTVIPEISRTEFVQAVRDHATKLAGWAHGMRHPGAQSYAVLTACRALYTHTHGEQASKARASSWAQLRLPDWSPLIRWAWDWRTGARDETAAENTHPQTVRFVHEVAEQIAHGQETSP